MITGTRREVVEILLEGDASATDIAEKLDLSVQTVHRHLTSLQEDGYVSQSGKRSGKTRPYKLYTVEESSSLFAIYDGKIVERSFEVTEAHKTIFSILQVPQSEFHSVLLSHLFALSTDWEQYGIRSIAVYGSVARGDATEESDIDLFLVTDEDEPPAESVIVDNVIGEFENRRIVSKKVATPDEVKEGLELDSQFLRNVFEEMIILYDPHDFLKEQKNRYVGQGTTGQGLS